MLQKASKNDVVVVTVCLNLKLGTIIFWWSQEPLLYLFVLKVLTLIKEGHSCIFMQNWLFKSKR